MVLGKLTANSGTEPGSYIPECIILTVPAAHAEYIKAECYLMPTYKLLVIMGIGSLVYSILSASSQFIFPLRLRPKRMTIRHAIGPHQARLFQRRPSKAPVAAALPVPPEPCLGGPAPASCRYRGHPNHFSTIRLGRAGEHACFILRTYSPTWNPSSFI